MRNSASLKVKSNARHTCQECGSTEFIQGHHEIAGNDNTLIALCAKCHSRRHPNIPPALFFSKNHQPYWHNKSASSLAREWGLHPRTIIRVAKRLKIPQGNLSYNQECILIANIPKLQIRRSYPKTKRKEKPPINNGYVTPEYYILYNTDTKYKPYQRFCNVMETALLMNISHFTVRRWAEQNRLPTIRINNKLRFDRNKLPCYHS